MDAIYSFEGFGEEVLWTFGVFFSALVGVSVLLVVGRSSRTDIHPQQVRKKEYESCMVTDHSFRCS